ncbi:MAG TPA: uridine kinase [Bacteroidetes bacterium]|nr:uridine kinase [bacterium BMS3Bbin04]HDO66447.1 uridine kinase [Bacteroidota bacterium]HEX05572.1 uridine kinase [Bacteroidota bacterium]
MKPIALVGIAGGTCSGKSLVADRLTDEVGAEYVLRINQDSYYRDLRDLDVDERANVNFDHPDAFAIDELVAAIDQLLAGKSIYEPIYNYSEHIREQETTLREPRPVIILEGILVLDNSELRSRMNYKVFVDEDADIRLARRIRRDEVERGRSAQSILLQYEESVRPMHLQFVATSKRYADIIIPRGGRNEVAIEMLANHVRALINHNV